jgi:hypothetical protein
MLTTGCYYPRWSEEEMVQNKQRNLTAHHPRGLQEVDPVG